MLFQWYGTFRVVERGKRNMNIGIVGAGRIGSSVAKLFAQAGHHVVVSHSGDPQALAPVVAEVGHGVEARTSGEAVTFGDIVVLAIPWSRRHDLPNSQLFANRIVIDAINPFDENGKIVNLGASTSSQEISKIVPEARLVKAFNTLNFQTLRDGGRSSHEDRLVLFLAGDDSQAKEVVARLIEEVGYAAVDSGFLAEGGRRQQPGSPIFNVPMTVDEARRRMTSLA
nr:NADPH-dependent F420 reductase [Ktedonosporobacter rubrisoli]